MDTASQSVQPDHRTEAGKGEHVWTGLSTGPLQWTRPVSQYSRITGQRRERGARVDGTLHRAPAVDTASQSVQPDHRTGAGSGEHVWTGLSTGPLQWTRSVSQYSRITGQGRGARVDGTLHRTPAVDTASQSVQPDHRTGAGSGEHVWTGLSIGPLQWTRPVSQYSRITGQRRGAGSTCGRDSPPGPCSGHGQSVSTAGSQDRGEEHVWTGLSTGPLQWTRPVSQYSRITGQGRGAGSTCGRDLHRAPAVDTASQSVQPDHRTGAGSTCGRGSPPGPCSGHGQSVSTAGSQDRGGSGEHVWTGLSTGPLQWTRPVSQYSRITGQRRGKVSTCGRDSPPDPCSGHGQSVSTAGSQDRGGERGARVDGTLHRDPAVDTASQSVQPDHRTEAGSGVHVWTGLSTGPLQWTRPVSQYSRITGQRRGAGSTCGRGSPLGPCSGHGQSVSTAGSQDRGGERGARVDGTLHRDPAVDTASQSVQPDHRTEAGSGEHVWTGLSTGPLRRTVSSSSQQSVQQHHRPEAVTWNTGDT